ncbi:MAG TPA: hypothetical protein VJL60_01885, partial [Gammaproteobacteria bacterium]|nr:hypothetical protein [Gammaproteobacteria bacterium]
RRHNYIDDSIITNTRSTRLMVQTQSQSHEFLEAVTFASSTTIPPPHDPPHEETGEKIVEEIVEEIIEENNPITATTMLEKKKFQLEIVFPGIELRERHNIGVLGCIHYISKENNIAAAGLIDINQNNVYMRRMAFIPLDAKAEDVYHLARYKFVSLISSHPNPHTSSSTPYTYMHLPRRFHMQCSIFNTPRFDRDGYVHDDVRLHDDDRFGIAPPFEPDEDDDDFFDIAYAKRQFQCTRHILEESCTIECLLTAISRFYENHFHLSISGLRQLANGLLIQPCINIKIIYDSSKPRNSKRRRELIASWKHPRQTTRILGYSLGNTTFLPSSSNSARTKYGNIEELLLLSAPFCPQSSARLFSPFFGNRAILPTSPTYKLVVSSICAPLEEIGFVTTSQTRFSDVQQWYRSQSWIQNRQTIRFELCFYLMKKSLFVICLDEMDFRLLLLSAFLEHCPTSETTNTNPILIHGFVYIIPQANIIHTHQESVLDRSRVILEQNCNLLCSRPSNSIVNKKEDEEEEEYTSIQTTALQYVIASISNQYPTKFP